MKVMSANPSTTPLGYLHAPTIQVDNSIRQGLGRTKLFCLCWNFGSWSPLSDGFLYQVFRMKITCHAGLVNYCVPAGEARLKALELARDINQKVRH